MSAYDDLVAAVPEGEAVRFHQSLRRGGRVVGLTDDRLLVLDGDGDGDGDGNGVEDGGTSTTTSVDLDAVVEVTVQDFDWFLAVLSVVLVGWGVLTVQRSLVVAVAALAFGGASLYRTYGRRGKVTVRVQNRPKPLVVYPTDADAFAEALRPLLDAPPESAGADA